MSIHDTLPICGAQVIVFFFNDTATTEIYTLSLHDALPIWAGVPYVALVASRRRAAGVLAEVAAQRVPAEDVARVRADRKSTRLNSSHANISYAVFCLKKKTIDQADRNSTRLHSSHSNISSV